MYSKKEVIEFTENVVSEGYSMNEDGELFHLGRGKVESTETILDNFFPSQPYRTKEEILKEFYTPEFDHVKEAIFEAMETYATQY